MHTRLPIILGSASPFRQELMSRLQLPFKSASPEIDETLFTDELPQQAVQRLAENKAKAVITHHPEALVIGSDQLACVGESILGKPGNRENAYQQLLKLSGKRVSFYTGLCLINGTTGSMQTICEPFYVHFRTLEARTIERYLDVEQPYQCAGSFKSEGLGIALFERLEGDDPNALVGLPLIQLVNMLQNEGVEIP